MPGAAGAGPNGALGTTHQSAAPHGPDATGPTLLFDGVCNLCNWAVDFVIRRDPAAKVRFASLQSDAACELLTPYSDQLASLPLGPTGQPLHQPALELADGAGGTLLLIENGQLYSRSTAVLKVAAHLRAPWPALTPLLGLPQAWRDRLYDFVSQRRYDWFGKRATCRLPTPDEAARFVG